MGMVDQIARQKGSRHQQCTHHETTVHFHPFSFDGNPPTKQQDSGDRVETGIQGWKMVNRHEIGFLFEERLGRGVLDRSIQHDQGE